MKSTKRTKINNAYGRHDTNTLNCSAALARAGRTQINSVRKLPLKELYPTVTASESRGKRIAYYGYALSSRVIFIGRVIHLVSDRYDLAINVQIIWSH